MLNEGTRTAELALAGWLLDPGARDADIIEAMRLPRRLSLETLLLDEMAAVGPYHRAWTANSGLDTAGLFLRNSACKRALYLSAPILLPDTIPVAEFVATGTNTRIHIYQAADVRDTVRLEAVSTFSPGKFRFRYALSIQYAADSAGLGWQVIRPVIVVDRRILEAVRHAGKLAARRLERVYELLRRIILFGSHDYVHATVLNWFPPLKDLPPAYAAITCERVHPPEVDEWHRGTQRPLPPGLMAGRRTPAIATLELYSLLVHSETVARIWAEEPRAPGHVRDLVSAYSTALDALLDDGLCGAAGARHFFMTLACWFLVSALPLGSEQLAEAVAAAPDGSASRACGQLAAAHDGMFELVRHAGRADFPWQGRRVPVHQVAAEYAQALRWPAVREHLRYLLAPAQRAGEGSWAQTLTAPLPAGERATLLAALSSLGACGRQAEREDRLAALAAGGHLDALRAIGEPRGRDGAAEPPPARYARALVADFVAAADALTGHQSYVPA